LFDSSANFGSENLGEGLNMEDIPDPTQIHDHITGMLDGKLGQLAREIAEETAAELNMDFENTTDMKDIFQKLIKNPTKLMGLVKNVGSKLDDKIKSGDLKETELIAEASEIMNKMKSMPGMGNIQSMLSKMGMAGMAGMAGGGGKMNMGAMEANLNQRMKMAQTRERCKAKAEANAKARVEQQAQAQQLAQQQPAVSEEELLKLFSSAEKAERTPRGAKPEPSSSKKKKKGKK
jgi:NADP-dependent 3-hydroxy acid dehydrogenase YdfG